MIWAIYVAVFAGLNQTAPPSKQPDIRELRHLVANIRSAGDYQIKSDRIATLIRYWTRYSEEDRKNFDPEVSNALSELLKDRDARSVATSMLFKLERYPKQARSNLAWALRDQDALEDYYYKQSYPLIPTTAHHSSESMRCVLKKMQSDQIDAHLCRFLPSH